MNKAATKCETFKDIQPGSLFWLLIERLSSKDLLSGRLSEFPALYLSKRDFLPRKTTASLEHLTILESLLKSPTWENKSFSES